MGEQFNMKFLLVCVVFCFCIGFSDALIPAAIAAGAAVIHGRSDGAGDVSTVLMPSFDICNVDKGDGGLTVDELHATACQDFITSVGGEIEFADMDFDAFDQDGNGIVSVQEFLATALMLVGGDLA